MALGTTSIQDPMIQASKPHLSKENILLNVRRAYATGSADALRRLGRAIGKAPSQDPSVRQACFFFGTVDTRRPLADQIEAYAQEPESSHGIKHLMSTEAETVARSRELFEASSRFYIGIGRERRGLFREMIAVIMMCLNQLVACGDAEFVRRNAPALLDAIEESLGTQCGGTFWSGSLREIVALCSWCEVPFSPGINRFFEAWPSEFLRLYPEWIEEV